MLCPLFQKSLFQHNTEEYAVSIGYNLEATSRDEGRPESCDSAEVHRCGPEWLGIPA